MEEFLRETRTYLNDLESWQKFHIVIGNEACDLDSAVSSLLYAYLLYKLNSNPEIAILPVLNTHKNDIHLKTEIIYLLQKNDIDINLPVCRNEIDLQMLKKKEKLLLTLVDHNNLSKMDKDLSSCVVEIIDHHKKGHEHYEEKCEITIEMVGSCSTLIAEKILLIQPSLLEKQTASLLYGTILLDTVCFEESAGKVTPKDISIAEELKKFLPEVNQQQLFSDIQHAKFDISGFTFEDLLRKDLKLVTNSGINIAVSSIPQLVRELTQRENLESEMKAFNSNHNYHVLVIMGIYLDKSTKEIKRDIGIYSINHVCKQQVADHLAGVASLQLIEIDSGIQCLSLYHQGNVTASRKVVLPLLHTFLIGENSEELQNHPMKMQLQDVSQKDFRVCSCDEFSESESSENNDLSIFTPPNGILPSASSYLLGFGDPLSLPISSRNSSNQNSCPYTPQNSYVDEDFEVDPYEKQLLPSFNSREMMEKIETKRGKLHGYEGENYSENYPFTPKNSYVDSNFDTYARQLPSFECDNFLQKVQEKQAVLEEFVREKDGNMISKHDGTVSPLITISGVCSDSIKDNNAKLSSSSSSDQSKDAMTASQQQKENLVQTPKVRITKSNGSEQCDSSGKTKSKEDDTSPEDNSLTSSQGDKGDEKMDTSTSGSDKDSGSPATAPVNDIKEVNNDVTTKNSGTKVSTSTSAYTTEQDTETELAFSYQAETVDFPDSPRHMKLMAKLSAQELTADCLDDLAMNQDEDDDVLRTVLSPGTDDSHSKKGRPTCLKSDKKKIIKVNPDILNSTENDEDAKSLSSLSNKSGDVLSPVDDMLTPVDIETPDELEDSILERLASVSDPIPEFSAAEEYDEERSWRTCVIAGVQRKIDMKVIEPYKKVLSHGGYCTDTHYAIIVFSACYLPDRSRRDYDYVMDNLFLYVLTTLDQLVADDYLLIYLHGATQRSNLPSFGWLKRCYQMIDRRLRKNLKGLYLVHPTFWLKTIVLMTKPFISSKFSRKLRFISCLKELAEQIPMDHLCIPEKVKQYDEEKQLADSQ